MQLLATMQTVRTILLALLLLSAPLVFLPWGFDTREVVRAFIVFVFAALAIPRAQLDCRWAWPWLAACLILPFFAAAPANETLLGALPNTQGTALWLAYAAIVLSAPTPDQQWLWPRIVSALTIGEFSLALTQVACGALPTGTFGHPVFLGAFAAIGVIVAAGMLLDAAPWRPPLALVTFAFGLATVFLAGRRGPLLMLVVAFVGMSLLLKARWRMGMIAALAGLVALGLWRRDVLGSANETARSRVRTFSFAWNAVLERPWFGHGPSRFADLAATWTPPGDLHYEGRLHNVWLLVAFSLGLLAALALVLFAAGAFVTACRNAAAKGSGSLAAAAMVGPAYGAHLLTNVDQPGVGLIAVALFATALTALPEQKKRPLLWVASIAFVVAGLLPVVASLGLDVCQRHGGELGCALADATGSSGCLAQRVRAAQVRKRDREGTAQMRLEWMDHCLARNDGDWLALYQHSLALYDAGKLDLATQEMTRVLSALPGLEEVQLSLAELYARAGRLSDAIIVLHPERARKEMASAMWRMRGLLLEDVSDLRSALLSYEHAQDLQANDLWLAQRIAELRTKLRAE